MNRPRVLAVSALVTGLLLVVLVGGCLGGGGGESKKEDAELTIRDPLAEALRYIPKSAAFVVVVETDTAAGPLRSALDLVATLPGSVQIVSRAQELLGEQVGLTLATEGADLAGSPAVIARTGTSAKAKTIGAWVVADEDVLAGVLRTRSDSGTLRRAGAYKRWTVFTRDGGAYAQRDRVLLTASDLGTLKAAVDRRLKTGRAAGLTPALFSSRATSGLKSRRPLVRVAVTGPGLRYAIAPEASRLAWLASLRGAGLAVSADATGVRLEARVRTDEGVLTEADLPLAPGADAPQVKGDAPVVVGVRDVAQSADLLRQAAQLVAPNRLRPYTMVRDLLKRFAQVDVEGDILGTLTEDGSVTVEDGVVVLRAETSDEERVAGALQRLARIGRLTAIAGSLGVNTGGIGIRDEGEARYTVLREEQPIAVVAVRDGVFVASSDPTTDIGTVLDAPDTPTGSVSPSAGALLALLTPSAVADLLVDRFGLPAITRVALEPLAAASVTGRAGLRALTLALDATVEASAAPGP